MDVCVRVYVCVGRSGSCNLFCAHTFGHSDIRRVGASAPCCAVCFSVCARVCVFVAASCMHVTACMCAGQCTASQQSTRAETIVHLQLEHPPPRPTTTTMTRGIRRVDPFCVHPHCNQHQRNTCVCVCVFTSWPPRRRRRPWRACRPCGCCSARCAGCGTPCCCAFRR